MIRSFLLVSSLTEVLVPSVRDFTVTNEKFSLFSVPNGENFHCSIRNNTKEH